MKIVYWGSSSSSAEILDSLIENNFDIVLVITQPDRQKGRGKKLLPTPVKVLATQNNIVVLSPDNPNEDATLDKIANCKPDLFFLCAYAKLLGKELLRIPNKGAVNLHFSLLPQLRGAAPIQRAIMQGFEKTGVTTFFMNESLDRGEIIMQQQTRLQEFETYGELEKRLTDIGKTITKQTIEKIMEGNFKTTKQNNAKKSYAKKILKEERIIDWNLPAIEIARKINGFSPSPGSYAFFRGKRIILLKARTGTATQGKVGMLFVGKQLQVLAGNGKTIFIEKLKPEGKKAISARDFINGFRVTSEDYFQNQK